MPVRILYKPCRSILRLCYLQPLMRKFKIVNMRYYCRNASVFLFLFFIAILSASAQIINKVNDPVEWVNPLMGTDSKPSLSNGNTYPAIGLPWGMNYWTPQTGAMGNGWQYQYSADKIRGFKQTHQPSPWMNDYGQFSIMPVTGRLRFRQDERASWFSHKAEIVRPYYYSVYLADADVTTALTTTERAAQFQFTYPKSDSSFLVIDAFDKGSYVKVVPSQNKIIGYSTRYSRGPLPNFRNYFVIYFDKPVSLSYGWRDSTLLKDSLEVTANHAGAIVGFKTGKGEKMNVKVASSFISFEQAELNLQREVGKDAFEITKQKSKQRWNDVLGRVAVEGGTEQQVKTFYSCLYRTVQFPQKLYEFNEGNKLVHYSPYNGKVEKGYLFGGTGFWDTFRALYPFLNLVYPDINKEMQQGLINDYKEGGWLPEWSSPGYADIMIGNNSASVVAEAYLKGLRGYDIETLYKALLHGANNEGPVSAVGRKGVGYYNQLGYVPYDVKINESAARTLEYAYDDFAIYQLAKSLGRPQAEIDLYAKRCQNYRNVFDEETKLMRGRNKDGSFQAPFNPFKWGDAFTEGNSCHYTWSVFHDIAGLKKIMGGDNAFVALLDSIFAMPPVYDESYYGGVIHEIREMQIMNMGQYAHGNQPIQHMIYLYNYAGQPWKTQYWVREAMNRLYKPTPDGYCGDEDNGQTSAWYVFSAMGFYPVCPATDQYVLGAPLFRKITVSLPNNKKLTISAPANGPSAPYVQTVTRDGKVHDKNWVSHFDLLRGGTLNFLLSSKPNKQRGTSPKAYPYSFSAQ
jgi:predicted alpha-1,2-mannosidase